VRLEADGDGRRAHEGREGRLEVRGDGRLMEARRRGHGADQRGAPCTCGVVAVELAVVVVVVVGAAWAVGAVLDGGQTDGEALSSEIVAAGLGLGSCLRSPEASEKHEENKLFAGAVGWGVPSLPREEALGPVLGAVGQLDPITPTAVLCPFRCSAAGNSGMRLQVSCWPDASWRRPSSLGKACDARRCPLPRP